MGRCDCSIAAALPLGCPECGPVGSGAPGSITSGIGGCANRTLRLSRTTKTIQTDGEDPSIFAIALETLAVKDFGDMGQTARLCLIRDRFIAGHNSCELCRHLDSVPPETPIRDIVDRCRVWESHADSDIRPVSIPGPDMVFPTYAVSDPDGRVDDLRVAAVATPQSTPDQVEGVFRWLLANAAATPAPTLKPEPSAVDQLLQHLVGKLRLGSLHRRWRPVRRDWKLCFKISFLGIWPKYGNLDQDPFDRIGMR